MNSQLFIVRTRPRKLLEMLEILNFVFPDLENVGKRRDSFVLESDRKILKFGLESRRI